MLHVSEAVTLGSQDYLKFLVTEAGYETAQVRADKLAERQAAAADARAKAQAEQQAIQAREMARLELSISADKAVQNQYAALSKKISTEKAA